MMSTNQSTTLPVLIVGSGPSGLMMAHELARYKIPVVLIEKDLEKSPYSRAIAVQIRTLEIFSALGLYEELAPKSENLGAIQIFAENSKPITIKLEKTSSSFERLLVVDQPHTEMVLENALSSVGQPAIRGATLLELRQHFDYVDAVIQYNDQKTENLRCSYVIGADGAHSIVRKSMSNQFSGTTYDDAFILADVECIVPFDHHTLRLFFRKKHFFAMFPMHGENHYRLISVRRGESQKQGPLPTIEEFHEIAQIVVPFPIEIKRTKWVSRFFVQCRSASHYQDGRMLLVGDAAHIHSPAGGQGMNTGLQDAFNLAWKLAMIIKGMAKPALLETYHDERKPVGDFLIDRTDRLFKFMVKSSIWTRLLRRFLLPRVARSLELRTKLFIIGSQTAIRYKKGALCNRSDHDCMPYVKIGARVVNLNLMTSHLKKIDLHTLVTKLSFSCLFFMPAHVDKKTIKAALLLAEELHDEFHGAVNGRLIFAFDYDAEKVLDEDIYLVALENKEDFSKEEACFVIVRPDHHVFCKGHLEDFAHAKDALRNFLQPCSTNSSSDVKGAAS